MKNFIFTFVLSAIFAMSLNAQTGYKKYALLEHFTNTRCSICGSSNPGFFSRFTPFETDIHHMTYHPSFPYSQCAIHQSNPGENSKRAQFYGASSTPYIYRNGTTGGSAGSTSLSILQGLVGGLSPVFVEVKESTGNTRTINVKVFSHPLAALPSNQNLVLYVAAVEKRFNFNAPNGETVHHNVFRKMIIDGQPIALAPASGAVEVNASYSMQLGWTTAQMYVMAWVQNTATKEIFNSGSSLDAAFVDAEEPFKGNLSISPNPARELVRIAFEENTTGNATLLDVQGRQVAQQRFDSAQEWVFDVQNLPRGAYFLRLVTDAGVLTRAVQLVD